MRLYKYTLSVFFLTLTLISFGQSIIKYNAAIDSFKKIGQKEKVIPFLEKKLIINPKEEALLRAIGFEYIELNDLMNGEKFYREALIVNPKCSRCFMNLGRIYGIRGDLVHGIKLLDTALDLDKNDASIYELRAKLREMNGDKFDALFDYKTAIELEPDNAEFYGNLGNYYYNQGMVTFAMTNIDKAIELMPNAYNFYYQRSNINFENRIFDKAMMDINKAIELDSNQYFLYSGRGAVFAALKDYKKSLIDYNKAIQLDPSIYYSYYSRSLTKYAMEDMDGSCKDIYECYKILRKNNLDTALKRELQYSIGNYCDSAKASYFYQRGIAFYNLGQFDNAIKIYSKGLKKFPNNPLILSFRANAFMQKNEYAKAISDYNTSLHFIANVPIEINANKPKLKESRETYLKGFEASARYSLAESKFAIGQYEEALSEINKGITIAPDLKEFNLENYYNIRGNILLALGKYQLAIADFDKCISINKNFVIGYVNKALAKLNLVDNMAMKSHSINLGLKNQSFDANWKLPHKIEIKKSDVTLISALEDCDKAIEMEPKLEFAYFLRGHLKKRLDHPDYCYDFLKAKDLGYPLDLEWIKECGN